MTIDQAKEAVKSRAPVWYNGEEYRANGILTWYKCHGFEHGWRNSLELIPVNGARSYTQALVKDCSLTPTGASPA